MEQGCHGDRSHLPGSSPFAGAKKLPGGNHSLRRASGLSEGLAAVAGSLRGPFRPAPPPPGRGAMAQHVFPPWHDRDAHPVVPITSASGLSCWGRLLRQAVSSASLAGAPARGGIGPEACVPGQAGSTMPPGRPRLALCPLSRPRPPRSLPPREDSVPPS